MQYQERHFTSDDGLRLYYRDYGGQGKPVVCIPGLTRNSKDFHRLALHLAPRCRVLCPDLRGRGQSARDPNWRNYTLAVYPQDLRRLMADAGVSRAVFVGTSLGGLVSMTMAYQTPEQVEAVILNDAGPEWSSAGATRILQAVVDPPEVDDWDAAARQAREHHGHALIGMSDAFWPEFARQYYVDGPEGKPVLDRDPRIGRALRSSIKAMKVLSLLNRLRLLRELRGVPLDTWEAFRSVTMPCLALRGASSDIVTEDIMARMRLVKPDLHCATVPDRGHAPLLDEPEAIAAIDDFLAGLQP